MVRPARRSLLHATLSEETEPLKALFRGVEVYAGLTAVDLREMAKFDEAPNTEGLPVHPIASPPTADVVREFGGALADLPKDLLRKLRAALAREPALLVRGYLAGGCRRPLLLAAAIPQSRAHLAHGFMGALWPGAPGAEAVPSDLFLIQIPEFDEQLLLNVPAAGVVLALGVDDPRGAMLVALECAHRLWSGAGRPLEGEAGSRPPEVALVAGGSFVIEAGAEGDRGISSATLILSGESIPDAWEELLVERLPELAGLATVEVALAGGEPWAAQSGGWVCPLWYNPPLPARALAQSERWAGAALDPAALPFGVRVGESGAIDLAGSPEEAFVIVPRRAIPRPFASSSAPVKVSRVITHRHSREEALALWAMGFPSAEIL